MASLVMITNDSLHRAATYVESLLEGFGHTVTLLQDADIVSDSDIPATDLLVVCRPSTGSFVFSDVHDIVRARVASGTPLLISGPTAGINEGIEIVGDHEAYPIGIKLCENLMTSSALQTTYMLNVSHPILAGVTGLPKSTNVYNTTTYQTYDYTGAIPAGATVLATMSLANSGYVSLFALEDNVQDLDGVVMGARVVFSSYLYSISSTEISGDGLLTLENAVDWLLETPPADVFVTAVGARRKLG